MFFKVFQWLNKFKRILKFSTYIGQNYEITIILFLMVFINIYIQFQVLTRIRIRNLELWIRIPQKVSDPCGSGSTTRLLPLHILTFWSMVSIRP
jgi:hypothetical protein